MYLFSALFMMFDLLTETRFALNIFGKVGGVFTTGSYFKGV